MYKRSLFIFRRDLRLEDNTALIEALKNSREVICCFIFDKRQVKEHPYQSEPGLQFMCQSLKELDLELQKKGGRLHYFYGIAEDVVKQIVKKGKCQAMFFNADYTPFSRKRDAKIQDICASHHVSCHVFHDTLLNPPGTVLKDDGAPYVIFTSFYNKAKQLKVLTPEKNTYSNYGAITKQVCDSLRPSHFIDSIYPQLDYDVLLLGGRIAGLKLLHDLKFKEHYLKGRNFPSKVSTSLLSAYHKFGTISIREAYARGLTLFGFDHTFLRELYWRDFFTHIGYHFPKVFGHAFYEKYDSIKWLNNKDLFEAWCEGKTGFPIVDAGMRELNQTGFMHNRVRMIVASFLVKDLLIDWRLGEKYFARKLLDYDPCVNNGNWQWAASTGCDAQPYFRIFNPWLQQKKFDKDCEYIKRWVPELKKLSSHAIHHLFKQRPPLDVSYPEPIVDHTIQRSLAKSLFSSVNEK